MSQSEQIQKVFSRIKILINIEDSGNIDDVLKKKIDSLVASDFFGPENRDVREPQLHFALIIIDEVNCLTNIIRNNNSTLISVQHQKLLRQCFQFITALGMMPCLIPGLGIGVYRKLMGSYVIPTMNLSDLEMYDQLRKCTDFFTSCYLIPILKTIIMTFYMSDYFAALIQLAFAPLKKPGNYEGFVMTPEMHQTLLAERIKYRNDYENLVSTGFQPIIMKELFILQGTEFVSPPMFVKKVISKELSRKLLAAHGVSNLIKCFVQNFNVHTGLTWTKINMICKLVGVIHGGHSENDYLNNICAQLNEILLMNDNDYMTVGVACIFWLCKEFPNNERVLKTRNRMFDCLSYESMKIRSMMPSTIVVPIEEVAQTIEILHTCINNRYFQPELLNSNIYLLFLLGAQKSERPNIKLHHVILKNLESHNQLELEKTMYLLLFGNKGKESLKIAVEEQGPGLCIKAVSTALVHPRQEAVHYFVFLVNKSASAHFAQIVFETCLSILLNLTKIREMKGSSDLMELEEEPEIINDNDECYALILELLAELASSKVVISYLKSNPKCVFTFIEFILSKSGKNSSEECLTISLVLLNTILNESVNIEELRKQCFIFIPILERKMHDGNIENSILCNESLEIIRSNGNEKNSAFKLAVESTFDNAIPVRAHGLMKLTKLINEKDKETIAKKHYLYCLFQEHLKDDDSYVYLSAINAITALGSECPKEVLHSLCKELLDKSADSEKMKTNKDNCKSSEIRMKIGDALVRITKNLGEMVIVHKDILLNTMLTVCQDDDPLIRTSALSNIAEMALVMNYKLGTTIYEILHCTWSILETDKTPECRRAAVMVVSSLLKGLDKSTFGEIKENLLPIYRTLKKLYSNENEDSVVRLHAQLALDEMNDFVTEFLFPSVELKKHILVLDQP